jgi:predicted nucleic acid-binding protein
MILLDTNVVSEPLRPLPSQAVVAWINAQPLETLFLSAITVAELRAGLSLLPAGKRRSALQDAIERRVLPLFAGRVLAFDTGCTPACAELLARGRSKRASIAMADACIAAIAATHRLMEATRDTAPLEASGVEFIDPWGTVGA